MIEKIHAQFNIDCEGIASGIYRGCTGADLEKTICDLVIEDCVAQLKYCGAVEWSEFEKIIKSVSEYILPPESEMSSVEEVVDDNNKLGE